MRALSFSFIFHVSKHVDNRYTLYIVQIPINFWQIYTWMLSKEKRMEWCFPNWRGVFHYQGCYLICLQVTIKYPTSWCRRW